MSTEPGTIRICADTLKPYLKTKKSWRVVKKEFPELLQVVKLFKAEKRFKELIDKKDSRFLKGQLSEDGLAQGARINILPDGQKLEKAFSLFAPHLQIHDQMSHDHWDVLYQNKGGTWSYVYTLEKRQKNRNNKYKMVDEFHKKYPVLVRNVRKALSDKNDFMAVPMYTLLNTYMRVGNETYFKAHGHKGLTTLTKENVHIKGHLVTFDYIGKDGVPVNISQEFPDAYIKRLKSVLIKRKKEEYLFSKDNGALNEHDFKRAFLKYCGKEFYPHIVRSHYATMKVKDFLSTKKKTSKEEVKALYTSIAHDLGHKKFNKKTSEWQESYSVSVNSYVLPELVQKIEKITVG